MWNINLSFYFKHYIYLFLFLSFSQILSVSPEHPVVFLMLRQVQCERLLLSVTDNYVSPAVMDQLNAAVMASNTSVSAWHVCTLTISLRKHLIQCQLGFVPK